MVNGKKLPHIEIVIIPSDCCWEERATFYITVISDCKRFTLTERIQDAMFVSYFDRLMEIAAREIKKCFDAEPNL